MPFFLSTLEQYLNMGITLTHTALIPSAFIYTVVFNDYNIHVSWYLHYMLLKNVIQRLYCFGTHSETWY